MLFKLFKKFILIFFEYILINNTIYDTTLIPYCLKYDNFVFLPIDSLSIDVYYIFKLLCQYDYLKLVKPKLNNENCLNEIFKSVQKLVYSATKNSLKTTPMINTPKKI